MMVYVADMLMRQGMIHLQQSLSNTVSARYLGMCTGDMHI